jgi:hypothetical protein
VGSSGSKRRKPKRPLPKVSDRYIDPPLDGVGPWSPSSIYAFGWRTVRAALYGSRKQKSAVTVIYAAPLVILAAIILAGLAAEAIKNL